MYSSPKMLLGELPDDRKLLDRHNLCDFLGEVAKPSTILHCQISLCPVHCLRQKIGNIVSTTNREAEGATGWDFEPVINGVFNHPSPPNIESQIPPPPPLQLQGSSEAPVVPQLGC